MALNITREHLGAEATAQDVARYIEAIDRIAPAFDGDLQAADAWLWGNGDYGKRLDAGCCIYCGELVSDAVAVPDVAADDDWQKLAKDHTGDCEWVRTRAHRI